MPVSKAKRTSSNHKRSKKRRNLLSIQCEKYYYPYYRGWCEGDLLPIFSTASSAMLWQVSQLYKDGFTNLFQTNLPLTFSVVGVIEVCDDKDSISKYLSKAILDVSDYVTVTKSQNSAAMSHFFQNLTVYFVTDESFFSGHIHKHYLCELDIDSFKFIQQLLSHPDYYFSAGSIYGNKVAKMSLINRNCTLAKRVSTDIYVPRCFDKYRLTSCLSYAIKQKLTQKSISDPGYTLDSDTVEEFIQRCIQTVNTFYCKRIIVSVCSGNSATEIMNCSLGDYIICLDSSKRDICTAIMCSKIITKQSSQRIPRVVHRAFNLRNTKVLLRLIHKICEETSIRPIILFQHLTPNAAFIENILAPALDKLLSFLLTNVIGKIVFVYDSDGRTNETNTIDAAPVPVTYSRHKINHVIKCSPHFCDLIKVSNELCISYQGEKKTFHPVFSLHQRSGWAEMKRKNEYCVIVTRS